MKHGWKSALFSAAAVAAFAALSVLMSDVLILSARRFNFLPARLWMGAWTLLLAAYFARDVVAAWVRPGPVRWVWGSLAVSALIALGCALLPAQLVYDNTLFCVLLVLFWYHLICTVRRGEG